jgi:hypothetical protein
MYRVPIMEMSQIAEARHLTIRLAHTLGFNETDTGKLALVVTTVEDQRKGLALGADAYYVKPIERLRLLDTLQRLTSRPQIA